MWKYQHPNGKREINDLTIPVNTPIKLTMTSEDVIHAFFVPAFRVKQDVLPGSYTTVWFEATKVGTYHQFCAEYCGTEHSLMGGRFTSSSKTSTSAGYSAKASFRRRHRRVSSYSLRWLVQPATRAKTRNVGRACGASPDTRYR